jgi:hypothetical protein
MRTTAKVIAIIIVLLLLILLVVVYIATVQPLPDLPSLKTSLAFGIGILVAVGIGGILTPVSRSRIYRRIDREFPKEACEERQDEPRGEWLPFWVGTVETFAYFLLFSFQVSGAGTFAIAWIALKMATGWNWFERKREWTPKDRFFRRRAFGALILNLLNVLFGVLGARLFMWLR